MLFLPWPRSGVKWKNKDNQQIGFSILNYAKLSLLSFYYDFLFKYLNRNDFEFLECDTDSSYIALSTQKKTR